MCHYLVVSTGVGIDGLLIYCVRSSVMCISTNALSLQSTSIIFITEVLSEGNVFIGMCLLTGVDGWVSLVRGILEEVSMPGPRSLQGVCEGTRICEEVGYVKGVGM